MVEVGLHKRGTTPPFCEPRPRKGDFSYVSELHQIPTAWNKNIIGPRYYTILISICCHSPIYETSFSLGGARERAELSPFCVGLLQPITVEDKLLDRFVIYLGNTA